MQEQYQRIQEPESSEMKGALLTALTAKMQDYIVLIINNCIVRPGEVVSNRLLKKIQEAILHC